MKKFLSDYGGILLFFLIVGFLFFLAHQEVSRKNTIMDGPRPPVPALPSYSIHMESGDIVQVNDALCEAEAAGSAETGTAILGANTALAVNISTRMRITCWRAFPTYDYSRSADAGVWHFGKGSIVWDGIATVLERN